MKLRRTLTKLTPEGTGKTKLAIALLYRLLETRRFRDVISLHNSLLGPRHSFQRRGCVAAEDGALFLAASAPFLFYSPNIDKQLAQQRNVARVRRVIRIQGAEMRALTRLERIVHPRHTFHKQIARATPPDNCLTRDRW